MKAKNLFLMTMVLLFGAVIKSSGQTTWSTTGNNGTNPSTNFIGTMDDVPLVFKIHSTEYGGVTSPFAGELHKFFTSFGYDSGHSGYSVYIGSQAGQLTIPFNINNIPQTSLYNTYVGHQAGVGSLHVPNIPAPGNYNTFLGNNSGSRNFDGHHNLFSGAMSGFRNTSGYNNVFLGSYSGAGNSVTQDDVTGAYNTFVGFATGGYITSGNRNTFIGHSCGEIISTGSGNTFLGNVQVTNPNLSNTIILGDGNQTQRLYIDNSGRTGIDLGNNPSIGNRLEINATGMNAVTGTAGLRFRNFTNQLTPITNPTSGVLSLNEFGDVIWVKDKEGTGGGTTGISNDCKQLNFLPRSDKDGNLRCSQVYDNWKGSCNDINTSGVSIGWCAQVPAATFTPSGTITGGPLGQTPTTLKLRVNGASQSNFTLITSDQNYKTNIQSLNRNESLEKVLNIRGYSYNWDKVNNPAVNFDDNDHTGFIAQELETVLPHLVYNTEDIISLDEEGAKYDKRKSVNYIELIPYLVESIKALNEKINGLEAQIQCLNESTGCNRDVVNKSNNTTSALENTKIISVSPNPSNDVISVSLNIEKSVQTATLNVYDLNGKLMSSLNINDRNTNITKTLQKDNFGTGVYIVSLVVNGKSIDSKKIVFK